MSMMAVSRSSETVVAHACFVLICLQNNSSPRAWLEQLTGYSNRQDNGVAQGVFWHFVLGQKGVFSI